MNSNNKHSHKLKNVITKNKKRVEDEEYLNKVHNLLKLINIHPELKEPNDFTTAIKMNLIKTVKLMIEYGYDVNKKNDFNEPPIFVATKAGNVLLFQLLLDHNADLNQKYMNITLLEVSVRNKYYKITKLLLKAGLNPNEYSDKRLSPIGYAIRNSHFDMIRLLIKYRVNLNTPFIITDIIRYMNIHKILPYLIRNGLDINYGTNALHYVMYEFKHWTFIDIVDSIKLLLQFGAKIKDNTYLEVQPFIDSMPKIPTLHTLTLRSVLIHEVDIKDVPKSVLQFS